MKFRSPVVLAAVLCVWAGQVAAEPCADPTNALGVSRIIEIDTSAGPLFGEISRFTREPAFLGPKEVVITIDDGPLPAYTRPILDALDKFCTKATFFSVGRMALAYPALIKEELARGHTVGTHTWSHPMNIGRLSLEKGIDQIERGHAAVTLAAGQPIAPFFRFPGLNDSDPLLAHLQSRGIGAFTVDVVSNDSYIASPDRLLSRVMQEVKNRNGGIMLFHDIKASTAKAMPAILKALKDGGYKVVHLKAKAGVAPIATIEAELTPVLAKAAASQNPSRDKAAANVTHQLQPFYAQIDMAVPETSVTPEITSLVPAARVRSGGERAAKALAEASEVQGTRLRRTGRANRALQSEDNGYGAKLKSKRLDRVKKVNAGSQDSPLFTFGQ